MSVLIKNFEMIIKVVNVEEAKIPKTNELRLNNKRSRKSPIKQVIREHTRMYCGLHQSEYSHQVEAISLTTKPDQSGLKRESFLANTHWKQ